MPYTKTTFVDGQAPYITADFLNGLQDFAMETSQKINESPLVNSSADNYEFTTQLTRKLAEGTTTLDDSNFPISIIFVASRNSVLNDTYTYKYNPVTTEGVTTYSSISGSIYDMSTKNNIVADSIVSGYPYEMLIVKKTTSGVTTYPAYINLDTKYLKYGNGNGFFNKDNVNPSSSNTSRLNYEGYMYATRFYGAVYNQNSADFAEGYPVLGECEPGDVISIEPDGIFKKNMLEHNDRILGIVSDEFAILAGTEFGSTPIAECGRVHAKVRGYCSAGDYLCAEEGHLVVCQSDCTGYIVAQALEPKFSESIDKILVRINRR